MASYDDTATVSGSVVSIDNGADDVPCKNVVVTLPASLDGYSSVDVVQTGKNLFNYEDVEAFNAGVIITRNDGDYTIQNNNSYTVGAFRGILFRLKPATYSLSIGEAISVPISIYKNGSWFNNGINAGDSSCTFTVSEEADYDFACNVFSNSSLTIKKCQFEVGSQASAFEQYQTPTTNTASLGRTIYGGSVDVVKGEGSTKVYKHTFTGDNLTSVSLNYGTTEEGYTHMYFYTGGIPLAYNPSSSNVLSDIGVPWNNNASSSPYPSSECYRILNTGSGENQRPTVYAYIHQTWASVEDFKAWLNANPITIVYEVKTETDFTFSPVEINSKLGDNTMWSKQGNIELTYYKSGYGFTSVTVHKETPSGEPVVETAKFHKIVYGGQADVVRGICEPKNLLDDSKRVFAGNNIIFGRDSGGRDDFCLKLKAGTYTFSVTTADGTYTNLYLKNSDTKERISGFPAYATSSKSFTLAEDTNCAVFVYKSDYTSVSDITSAQIEKGSTASEYVPHFEPFSFPPISMETDDGENTLFANEGDSSITYRKAVE